MSTRNLFENCKKFEKENALEDSVIENSDESVIEGTPTKKKVKRAKRKKICAKVVKKSNSENTEHLLEKLVQEFEKNVTQKIKQGNGHQCLEMLKFPDKGMSQNEPMVERIKQKQISEQIINKELSRKNVDPFRSRLQKPKENLMFEHCEFSTIQKEFVLETGNGTSVTDNIVKSSHTLNLASKVLSEKQDFKRETKNSTFRGLTKPIRKTLSKNYHRAHVFYLIEEITKFDPNYFPRNSCIQLVGVYDSGDNSKNHFLLSFEKYYSKSLTVKLNLREMSSRPHSGDEIILFGSLSFEDSTLVVIGKFFQKFTVNANEYISLMLRLRTTMPYENFDIVRVSKEELKCDESMANLDESNDEFSENASGKTSEEYFFEDELSDLELCAFLDNIALENFS